MKKALLTSSIIVSVLFFASSSLLAGTRFYRKEGSGPMTLRNQMPLYLIYLQMAPDRASVIEQRDFKIDADYTVSNITASAFTPVSSLYDINIDVEISRLTLDFRYGLYENLEIGLELPYVSFSSGYLDGFIESFEDGIGAQTPRSRERQGSYEFDYSFVYDNVYLIREKHSMEGLGDIVLDAKYQLLKEKGWFKPNISMRTAIKFPTGEDEEYIGSGELDYGVGILVDKSFYGRLFIYSGLNFIRIKKPGFFSVLSIENGLFSGLLGLEYFFTERLSFITQVTGNSTPYPSSGTNVLDNNAFELGLGINYIWKERQNIMWHFGFTENIKSASSPDASFHTGLRYQF